MKQYVFYDKKTGEINHVERIVDPKTTASLYAEVPTTSSRSAVQHVDLKTHKLVTKRLTAREQDHLRRSE